MKLKSLFEKAFLVLVFPAALLIGFFGCLFMIAGRISEVKAPSPVRITSCKACVRNEA